MAIIERNDPMRWSPEQYEYVQTRVVDGKKYGVKLDLRDYTLPTLETVDAVSWLDGAKYGTNNIIDHRIDWDKVHRKIDSAFKVLELNR